MMLRIFLQMGDLDPFAEWLMFYIQATFL